MNGNRTGVVRDQTVNGVVGRGNGIGRVFCVLVVRRGEVLAMDRLAGQTDVSDEHDRCAGAEASAKRERDPGCNTADKGGHDG
jgi:hypothetical protein